MPPDFSSTAISTETPETIMMMPHGIARTAAASSAALATRSTAEAANADKPRLTLNTRTPTIQAAINDQRRALAAGQRDGGLGVCDGAAIHRRDRDGLGSAST